MTQTLDRPAGLSVARRVSMSLAVISIALALLAVAIFVLPAHLAPRSSFASAADAVRAQNDARGLMLQGLGGLVLLLGAYVTWRQLQVNRDGLQHNLQTSTAQLKAAHDQLRIAQEGQITQRFAQSVDQLGSDQIVVRLGGIYALERIAANSLPDAATIAEIFSSYIRQYAPRPAGDQTPDGPPEGDRAPDHLQVRAADVQAALSVLAKGSLRPEGDEPLRLLGADLRRANLWKAQLVGADLEGTHLGWAWLRFARLEKADLTAADLRAADLTGANLDGAELTGAQLQGAHLEGASLLGANLDHAQLDGALADQQTRWPEGFDPHQARVTLAQPGS
jgi:hypothetical protein